jgi:hypothetical protein
MPSSPALPPERPFETTPLTFFTSLLVPFL